MELGEGFLVGLPGLAQGAGPTASTVDRPEVRWEAEATTQATAATSPTQP